MEANTTGTVDSAASSRYGVVVRRFSGFCVIAGLLALLVYVLTRSSVGQAITVLKIAMYIAGALAAVAAFLNKVRKAVLRHWTRRGSVRSTAQPDSGGAQHEEVE